jgi:hypothetical protein
MKVARLPRRHALHCALDRIDRMSLREHPYTRSFWGKGDGVLVRLL